MAPALSLFCANFSQVPPLPPSNHPHRRDINLPQASFHGQRPESSPANVQQYQVRGYTRNNPQLPVSSHAQTDRHHMMSDALHTTVTLRYENMMKTYLPAVDPAGFVHAFPKDKVSRINVAFKVAAGKIPGNKSGNSGRRSKVIRPIEKTISEAWRAVDKTETLCPGYVLNLSEKHADSADPKKYKIDGALISVLDKDLIEEDHPNWFLDDLTIEFKRGGTANDAFNDRANKEAEADAGSRTIVRGQLLSYGERVYFYQHRTGLFMLFVNGDEFRIIRWDRSGCIVTEALNYVETIGGTEKLLQFLYAYSQASPEQRGFDTTATRLSEDSCGWQWMQKVAMANPQDLDHTDGTTIPSIPDGFAVTPDLDPPQSPLFAANILHPDPSSTSGFGDLSSDAAASHIIPVFRYVRDLFRGSLPANWRFYSLKVGGGYYLVGKPVFEPHGLVGRGTRGYVALEWTTQRLVFLKDAWRPFYVGVEQEGMTLGKLNKAQVQFIPTLICHEDVGGPGAQETQASEYSSTGKRKPDVFGEQDKDARPIAPMPSRSKASGSRSGSTTTRQRTKTSASNEKPHTDDTHPRSGEGSGKRARPQDTAPVELRDRSGLRHLTHYRIVVAEVGLPSTAITCGRQLARVIMHCMLGHQGAATRCNLLHRDVSSGNILILPTMLPNRPERGQGRVIWAGMLCDWELAKVIPTALAKSQARQPHRTGTWYYMSVYSLTHPTQPVSIADELESFFHVLLYLAVRLLRTAPLDVTLFIRRYFMSSEPGQFNQGPTCGALKQAMVYSGLLKWGNKLIRFVSKGSDEATAPPTPLNDIMLHFMEHLKARYAVLEYEEEVKNIPVTAPPLPSLESVMASTSSLLDDDVALLEAKGLPEAAPSRPPHVSPLPGGSSTSRPIEKPSQGTYKLADALETHASILELFRAELSGKSWPQDDYAGDQLKESYSQESQSKAKKARLDGHTWSTGAMQAILEEEDEMPERPHTAA